ncbi:dockerin type I domain-containing protein [Breznakia pachnodae]|uniref:Beta-N-acetylglucosaminidase n=1 Tax=Breznakia pachnodae TaxID=265178 RepID=A0ABU0DZ98_9FIRM|nr:dockerin type I domain-containing protein [Breznakia pachnodae]MDQ0359781.1 beta-N-acetylglucosaminidase [Breznakia pachnodae]
MKKKGLLIFTSLFILISIFASDKFLANDGAGEDTSADEAQNFEVGEELDEDHMFTTMDAEGNIIEYDMSELEEETAAENSAQMRSRTIATYADVSVGVVNFKTKSSSSLNTTYTEDGTNRSGYVNGYYAADAAFLGYNSDRSKVKFMQAGVIGWVNASEVQVLDYTNTNQVKSVNFYRSEGGTIIHYGTNNISSSSYWLQTNVGPRQSYMQDNVVYYSYDGHYFYTTYSKMISDYKAGTRANSINPNNPYYNYYQYLSHRTKTNFTAANFNSFLLTKTNSSSKMNNLGSSFIQYQNSYGVNASLTFGIAANESAWGQSSIAKNKNNLFGHAAYDSDPSGSANGYSSAAYSIYYHTKVFISEGYLDTKDYSGRYYGSHLGDKASGINVKYASDPYWGEKAAAISWQMSKTYGAGDAGKYTIAIKSKGTNLNVRKEASSSSTALYQTGTSGDYPFIILGTVTGESINGNNVWYKIQSDTTLNANRTALTQDKGDYDYNNYYGYIHSSYVTIVNTGSGGSTGTVKGDVNGDGKVTSADYLFVKAYIMGTKSLTSDQQKAADVNGDGKVTSADYLKIKAYIMGTISGF